MAASFFQKRRRPELRPGYPRISYKELQDRFIGREDGLWAVGDSISDLPGAS